MAITIQSTYATDYTRGFAGMVANGEASNRISRTVEDAAGIAFGKAAFRGAADHGATGTPAAGKFLGIVIADAGVAPLTTATADIMPQYSTAGLLNEGVIFVTAGEAVVAGDQAYVTAGGVINKTLTSNTLIPAKFDETAASGAIVRLRVTRS